jgi:hypothetical protein
MGELEPAIADYDTTQAMTITPESLHLDQLATPSSAAEAAATEGKYCERTGGKRPLAHKL